MYGPVMDKVGQEVPVQKINVDEQQDLAIQYSVRSVPTVILVDSTGKELARKVGIQPKDEMIQLFKNFS
jgi:thioredoxin-like negative regulator of GroEL